MRLKITHDPAMKPPPGKLRLVVFSDDWGRHPSSSQHLVRQLLWKNQLCCHRGCRDCREYQVLWVNTLGTRTPELTCADLTKAVKKLGSWARPQRMAGDPGKGFGDDLRVLHPKMWPGFRRLWQRRLNAGAIQWYLDEALGPRRDEQRVVLTTLPITADLVGRLDVDRWVYYCVDDFSAWPGLDSDVMRSMERDLVAKVDDIITVSDTLTDRITQMGRSSTLLTHGIDLAHWSAPAHDAEVSGFPEGPGPVALFWGLIDRRLDVAWCRALAEAMHAAGGRLVLAGPTQSPDEALAQLPGVRMPGPVPYDDLPAWAARADVLVMPYADAEVTRAMQPLKFKEYLATGRPVVVRDLPSTRGWAGAADVVADAKTFVQRVMARLTSGLPDEQAAAREWLSKETWTEKAKVLARIVNDRPAPAQRRAA